MKALKHLTNRDIDQMPRNELVQRLNRLNPFGGYNDRASVPVASLRATLKNWRDRG